MVGTVFELTSACHATNQSCHNQVTVVPIGGPEQTNTLDDVFSAESQQIEVYDRLGVRITVS